MAYTLSLRSALSEHALSLSSRTIKPKLNRRQHEVWVNSDTSKLQYKPLSRCQCDLCVVNTPVVMESASVAFSEWIDSSSCPLEQSGRWFQLSGGWPDRRYDPQARWSGSQSRLEQHRVFYRYVRMPLIREDDSEDSSDEDVPGYALGYMRVDVTQMRECFQPGAVRCGKCSVVLTPSDTEWPEPALPHAMPELKTEIPYDQTNTSISDACKHCCHKVTPAVARKLWAELEQSHQGKSKRRVVGCVSSDMSAMDDWCGQQKSGCTHYCFGCAALKKDRLSYKQSGSIHSPHTLYKYQLHDCRKQEVKQPMHRTFEKMTQQAVEYAAEYQKYEAELAKAKESEAHQKATTGKKQKVTMPKPPEGKSPQFQNIIHRPLKSTGKVIHVVGSMALHICLGVRKLAYDMFEAEIRKLDNELKGWGVEGLASLSKLQDKLYTANAAVEDSRLEYEATLPAQESHLEAEIKEMESLEDDGDGWALRKNKGPKSKYKESCDDAKEIQEKYAALKSQLASVVAAINNSRDEMHENEKKVKAIRAELNQHDGPLMVDVRELLSELRLERQVYHSGAFNGNDLDKLYAVDVIHQLSSILAPRRVRKVFCVNGTTFEASILFGSFEMAQKYCTLFHKLRQLKTLYRATRPLCKHEVRPFIYCTVG